MAEKKTVKTEVLTVTSFSQGQEAHVNNRAASIQKASKSGNMSNEDGAKAKNWNYNIGAAE